MPAKSATEVGCYHIWVYASSGSICYRWKTCYPKKQTADAAVRRWKKGPRSRRNAHRPRTAIGYMVLPCKGQEGHCGCPCATGG